jgi:hypothetical protein
LFGVFPAATIIQFVANLCRVFRARRIAVPQDWVNVSAILFDSIRAQGRKAEIAPVSTKMKPGVRILRTIA